MPGIGNALSINRGHQLLSRAVGWWKVLPSKAGGPYITDILNGIRGTRAGTTLPAWRGGNRAGGQGSLNFDGATSRVDLGSGLAQAGDFTVAAWAYSTASGATRQIFCRAEQSVFAQNWMLFQRTKTPFPDVWSFQVSNNSGTSQECQATTTVAANTWVHVAGVYKSSGTQLKIYVNGVNENTVSGGAAAGTIAMRANIGCYDNGASDFWSGAIDDCVLWSRALSAIEVKQLYLLSRQGYPGIIKRRSGTPNAIAAATGGPFPWFSDYELTGPHWHGGVGC